MQSERLLALDFDGVVCDSARETALSGWRGVVEIWAEPKEMPPPLLRAFRQVRPVLHTGWQSIILLRLLLDGRSVAELKDDADGRLLAGCMATHGLDASRLKQVFGDCRDEWIKSDRRGWLSAHGSYPGIVEGLHCYLDRGGALVIITTKQQRFAELLLESFGLQLPPGSVYGLESGPKSAVLTRLASSREGAGIIFVEDRLTTLLDPELLTAAWLQRWLAEWGYVTASDLRLANAEPAVERWGLSAFCRWLRSAGKDD